MITVKIPKHAVPGLMLDVQMMGEDIQELDLNGLEKEFYRQELTNFWLKLREKQVIDKTKISLKIKAQLGIVLFDLLVRYPNTCFKSLNVVRLILAELHKISLSNKQVIFIPQ
jgi:hypothetical protein